MGFNLTPVVKNLLIINFLLFLLSIFCLYQFNIDLVDVLGLYYFNSPSFQPYQIFTHMFMHSYVDPDGGISIMHILSNMFGLFMFGPMLERVWGAKRFLIYYIVCGLGAALIHSAVIFFEVKDLANAKDEFVANPSVQNLIQFAKAHGRINPEFVNAFDQHHKDPIVVKHAIQQVKEAYNAKLNVPMVGASGAVFGILLGFGMLFPNTVLMLLFPPIPIKAKYFVLFYGLFELYAGVQVSPGDNIAHFAHLGGMLFGFLMITYWNKRSNRFY
ncbi:MAG: rhomboid family intramembrane serine protease [Cytophagaceae bacterium]|nr:rhomboid family intramembrane serine protease [Cytophagaceae bacterium]